MPDHLTPRQRGARNRAQGEAAEWQVRRALTLAGFHCVEPIKVGWNVKFRPGTRIPISAYPIAKVSGDFQAVAPGGRAVHVEVKRTSHLVWSDLEDHQVKALNDKAAAGALALLAWVIPEQQPRLYAWPVPGFGPGKAMPVNAPLFQ